jgi:hypothetical protein
MDLEPAMVRENEDLRVQIALLRDLLDTATRERDKARDESRKADEEALAHKVRNISRLGRDMMDSYGAIKQFQRRAEAAEAALAAAPIPLGCDPVVRERDALREAMAPFAKAADVRLCGDDTYWTDDKTIQGTDIAFYVTFGDLRRARAALSQSIPIDGGKL